MAETEPYDPLEYDLSPLITSTSLLIENASEALEVLWLVECRVLHPLEKPLVKRKATYLGHGHVLVWMDRRPNSRDIRLDDGRLWKYAIQRRGVFVSHERREQSELCRYSLTVQRNVIDGDKDAYMHIVAYHDRGQWARETPKVRDDPRLKECVDQMPRGYFIPEFGELASDIPPPMPVVDHRALLKSLPDPVISPKLELPPPTTKVTVTTEVTNVQIIPQHWDQRWATKATVPESNPADGDHAAAASPPDKSSEPEVPEVSYCEVALPTFKNALLSNPATSSMIAKLADSISLSEGFIEALDLYAPWARYYPDVDTGDSNRRIVSRMHDIFQLIRGAACDFSNELAARCDLRFTRASDDPTVTFIPIGEHSADWRSGAFFICIRPAGSSHGATSGSSDAPSDLFAFAPTSRAQCDVPHVQHMERLAAEFMSFTGTRRHVLGADITGFMMRLWYFDRAGAVYTTAVDIRAEPVRFITTLISLQCASDAQWGFESTFLVPSATPSLFGTVAGYSIELGSQQYELTYPAHITRSLYGPATSIFEAHRLSGTGSFTDNVMVKLSWQPTHIASDDELFRLAEREGVKRVAKLYLSSSLVRLSGSCRGGLCSYNSYCDRELRVQLLGPHLLPLYAINDVPTFKTAFKSLVKVHHDLYEKSGILHRDINVNNLTAQAARPTVGTLADLSRAVHVNSPGVEPRRPSPLIGTLPFASIELLADTRPRQHQYRFDLESFFFVLVWIMTHYRNGKPIDNPAFRSWYTGEYESIEASKLDFFAEPTAHPFTQLEALGEDWVEPLADLFLSGYRHKEDTADKDGDEMAATLDGLVTFEKFYAILQS